MLVNEDESEDSVTFKQREHVTQNEHSSEGYTTKKVQHIQVLALVGLTKPKTPNRDNEYHNGGYQLSLSTKVFFIRL